MNSKALTLYEKIWNGHVVYDYGDGRAMLYIDRHLVNEVTSPQAFEGLRLASRKVWRPESIIATVDHNTPTTSRYLGIVDPLAREQVDTLNSNILSSGALAYFPFEHEQQGIVHVVAPELGATLPGMTIVCGDSHTSTHGAFAALAFGIGTSDVEQVLATQTLTLRKSKTLLVEVSGQLAHGVYAKDLILGLIGKIGTSGGAGYVIEYRGCAISNLSMEGRMTLCNMSIEAGARAGLVAVDNTTVEYLKNRLYAPKGKAWEGALKQWECLYSDDDAKFDKVVDYDVFDLEPQVTWGTSPDMVSGISGSIPDPSTISDSERRNSWRKALDYMGLEPGVMLDGLQIDKVFIGSCTNARIEDLREAAAVVCGRQVAPNIKLAMVVPGSGSVKRQAEAEGLDVIFRSAGFEWREPGCSMCLAMNDDKLLPGERCASTSNRNFEGRQGAGGRSHLVSPAMAAAAAIKGHLTDVRSLR